VTDRLAVDFLGTFESLRMGPTFARGRRDERAGHVRNLMISGSLVIAQVRGPDDPAAFRSRIALRAFGASEWARIEQDLAGQARYVADLLAGRMPDGIAEVFAAAGLSLVPLSLDEVAMDCTCERWPMPCVHLAAACYALARAFEEDPFAVFAWRGRNRDELLTHLRELRSAHAVTEMDAAAVKPSGRGAADDGSGVETADAGLEADLHAFWGLGGPPPLVPTGARPGAVTRPDALLDQLDPPPLAYEGRPIVDLLRPAYRALPEGPPRDGL
jgi:uncharacterized Zn finger protein